MKESVPATIKRWMVLIAMIYCAVSSTQTAVAQVPSKKAEKGYDRYNKKEYKESYDYYLDAIRDNESDILANYGMALLYSNSSFKLDYDKAYTYIRKAMDDLKNQMDVDITSLNKLIPDVRGTVAKEYEGIERKYAGSLDEKQNIDDLNKFVRKYPDSKYWKDIFRKGNHEYFITQIKESRKVSVYNQFIEQYQDAEDLQEAIRLRDFSAYNDLRSDLKLESVYDYLNRYPNSEQIEKVIQLRDSMEFAKVLKVNTTEAYMDFIIHYPHAQHAEKAVNNYLQLEWEKVQTQSDKQIQDFIYRYYSSEQGQTALQIRDNYLLEKAKTKGTVDAYNIFITYHTQNLQKLQEARKLRDQKAFDDAVELNTINDLDDFIYKYPFANQIKEASERRDTMVISRCRTLISLDRYDELMSSYPILNKSPQAHEIREKLAYNEAAARNTVEDYNSFLQEYPSVNSPYRKKAVDALEKLKKAELKKTE